MKIVNLNIVFVTLFIMLTGCKEKEYIHVGPNWDALHKLESSENHFQVTGIMGDSIKLGERLQFQVKSERDGRLWVVQVDGNDEISVLIPNANYSDNTILANQRLTLPKSGATWELYASEPAGTSLIAFIVTTGNTDIRDVLNSSSRETLNKALSVVRAAPAWGIDKHVLEITKIKE